MSALTPFLVAPRFHERVWGARDLRPYFDRRCDGEPIGEVWLTGEECKASSGPLAGQSLGELARRHGRDFTGPAAADPERFPLLIKFLFPRQKLSVQVHPDDRGARAVGQPCGKTECWYIAQAGEGARMGVGLRPGITREMFRMAVEAKQAEHMLNWMEVGAGEMIYVDAGTVHAVGPDAVIVETQQNSDITYRLYDYGRPRELHLERGIEAMREKTRAGRVSPGPCEGLAMEEGRTLVASSCFVVEKYCLRSPRELVFPRGSEARESVEVLVALDGLAVLAAEGSAPMTVARGEAAVIPASSPRVTVGAQRSAELLRMRLPSGPVAEPLTKLHTETASSREA